MALRFNRMFVTLFIGISILCLNGCGPKSVIQSGPVKMEEDAFSKAERAYASGKYETALKFYGDYLNRSSHSPLSPAALMKMGNIYQKFGEYEKALNRYDKILTEYPDSVFVADAGVDILEILFLQAKYSELVRQVYRLPREKFSRAQLVRISMLTGDAFWAMGLSIDAAQSFIIGYDKASETEKITLKQRILESLITLDDAQFQVLASRLVDPDDVKLIENLNRMKIVQKKAVGCLLPLTGQYEMFGQRALRGIELALHQFGITTGRSVKIILKDTKSDPAVAVEKVQELFDEEVACIIGPIAEPIPAVTKAQELGIPIIALSQKDGIPEIGDYVFRNFLTPQMQVESLVSYAIESMGATRFAILYPNEQYGNTFMNLFKEEVMKRNGEVVGVQSYEPGLTDFADPIRKLVGIHPGIPSDVRAAMLNSLIVRNAEKENNPYTENQDTGNDSVNNRGNEVSLGRDLIEKEEIPVYGKDGKLLPIINFEVLFIPDSPKTVGLILPQLAYHDVNNVTLFGTNLWHSEILMQMAGPYAQGAVFPEGFFAESDAMPVSSFVASYKEIFDTDPGYFEAVAYDTAVVIFQLLSNPNISLRDDIRDALLNMTDFDGVTGLTTFSDKGEAHKKLYLLKLVNDRFVEINK